MDNADNDRNKPLKIMGASEADIQEFVGYLKSKTKIPDRLMAILNNNKDKTDEEMAADPTLAPILALRKAMHNEDKVIGECIEACKTDPQATAQTVIEMIEKRWRELKKANPRTAPEPRLGDGWATHQEFLAQRRRDNSLG